MYYIRKCVFSIIRILGNGDISNWVPTKLSSSPSEAQIDCQQKWWTNGITQGEARLRSEHTGP